MYKNVVVPSTAVACDLVIKIRNRNLDRQTDISKLLIAGYCSIEREETKSNVGLHGSVSFFGFLQPFCTAISVDNTRAT